MPLELSSHTTYPMYVPLRQAQLHTLKHYLNEFWTVLTNPRCLPLVKSNGRFKFNRLLLLSPSSVALCSPILFSESHFPSTGLITGLSTLLGGNRTLSGGVCDLSLAKDGDWSDMGGLGERVGIVASAGGT